MFKLNYPRRTGSDATASGTLVVLQVRAESTECGTSPNRLTSIVYSFRLSLRCQCGCRFRVSLRLGAPSPTRPESHTHKSKVK